MKNANMKLEINITPTIKNRPRNFNGLYSAHYTVNGKTFDLDLCGVLCEVYDIVCEWWARMVNNMDWNEENFNEINRQLHEFKTKVETHRFFMRDGNEKREDEKIGEHGEAVKAFLGKLPMLHAEAGALGLHVTARALHNAVKASGWEVTGDIVKAGAYAPNLEGS